MKKKEKILNRVFGSKNVLLTESSNNNIYVGDQNIYFDLEDEKLKTRCPKCGEAADEDSAENNDVYKSFFCSKCGNTYYEYDEIARNVSNYLDLNGQQSIEFERLISAVNHDLQVGFLKKAFDRCLNHKETYGNTPQIYEWGALTLFLTTEPNTLIKTSCRQIIAYLDKARQIDYKGESESYDEIASSIATRYFQILFSKIEHQRGQLQALRNNQSSSKELDSEVAIRKKIFRLLIELNTCYKISKDTDFIIPGLQELYGYNVLSWFKISFISFFSKPKKLPDGYRRGLKGYVWDYHKVVSNCDEYFEGSKILPSNLTIIFENILLENGFSDELSEIRIGKIDRSAISTRANLILITVIFYLILTSLIVGLFYTQYDIFAYIIIALFIILGYLNRKSNNKNVDQFRRIINMEREGDFKLVLRDIRKENKIDDKVLELKNLVKKITKK